MRVAHISGGVVVNITMEPSSWTSPGDGSAVATTTANIGDSYSGGIFTVPIVVPTTAQLITYAVTKSEIIQQSGITVNLGTTESPIDVPAQTDFTTYARLSGAAAVAAANPSATVVWIFYPGTPMTLTAANVITLKEAIDAFYIAVQATLGAVVTAINAATVVSYSQIDSPPSPLPAWPANS